MRKFDYLFAVRPATICNFNCSYCYRQDFLNGASQTKFNIDSMLWHSEQKQNNIFNFCGYGETMMHPQFADMIIQLSKITTVNWITNGTMFKHAGFKNILKLANHKNIMDVIISIHVDQITDPSAFSMDILSTQHELNIRGVRSHLTAIATNENINDIIMFKNYFYALIVKPPFDIYAQNGKIIKYTYTEDTLIKLKLNDITITKDWLHGDMYQIPYTGKPCTNGSSIFEVMHDGSIYDCSFDENKIIIGNINTKEHIQELPKPRLCKSSCITCVPALRNAFGLVK